MNARRLSILAAGALLAGSARAAQEGGLDILDGETLWSEGGQVFLSEIVRRKSHLYDGDRRVSDPLDQVLVESRTTLGLNYGVLPELTVSALVPFVHTELRFDGPAGREEDGAAGLGDITLLAKYRLYKHDWHLGSFNWTAFAGSELPTGRTGVEEDGVRLPTELQPGSGSWDLITATAATYEQDRFKATGTLLYERAGENAHGHEFGDLFVAELTPGYRFVVKKFPGPLLRADLGLQLRHESAARDDGNELANTGGDTFFLRPGLVYWPRPWWGVVLSAELPVWRDLEGIQLAQDYGVFLSLSYRF